MSENNDLFGYEEIFEDKQSWADAASIIGFIIRAILAITTAGFFFVYAGNLFDWLTGPAYSPYLSAVVGTFCIDVLAYGWSWLRPRNGNTETQIKAAKIGTIGNIALSVLVTAVFIILLTDFIAIHNPDGSLNQTGESVNIIGLLIATLAISGNGALWAYYEANSAAARTAMGNARLTAARHTGQFAIRDRENRMIIGRTMEELKAALPHYTNDAARRNSTQYLLDNFKAIDRDGDGRLSDRELASVQPPAPKKERAAPKYIVWLCDETGKRVTRHRPSYNNFKEADQAARRLSFQLAPGDKTAVYLGDEMIANYTTFDKGSTADMTPVNYENGRPPQHEAEAPGGPDEFEVYINLPAGPEADKDAARPTRPRPFVWD